MNIFYAVYSSNCITRFHRIAVGVTGRLVQNRIHLWTELFNLFIDHHDYSNELKVIG